MGARIKKGDMVQVIAGDENGKTGKVLQVLATGDRALVEGLNFVKKHMRKSQDHPQGGVIEKEAPIHLSNLKKAE
jgi:large subunit ribosomal protein L24